MTRRMPAFAALAAVAILLVGAAACPRRQEARPAEKEIARAPTVEERKALEQARDDVDRDMRRLAAEKEAEIERLRPVIHGGGYIPGCDHGIPTDVSWSNYLEYCRLLAQATGWLAREDNGGLASS